jgi:hypothetical protein
VAVKRSTASPSRVPAHVIEWMGARVIAPTSTGPREGVVTSVGAATGLKKLNTPLHICIDDGPVVYLMASEVTRIGSRSKKHEELDKLAT